jgi:hypothetical protein
MRRDTTYKLGENKKRIQNVGRETLRQGVTWANQDIDGG